MTRHNPKTVFQVIVEAAVNLWTTHQAIHAGDAGAGMTWWNTIRRWAAAIALRFGNLAIYAETRYYQAAGV